MKSPNGPTLQFLGASGTVTGSRFLIAASGARLLLDCGLFQGGKKLRGRNWDPWPFAPLRVDAVVLSHGHLDHSGYLPVFVRDGFRGPVHCTAGTRDLLQVLLPDAAKLEEELAARMNRYRLSKHDPARPLFTSEDAAAVLEHLVTHPYGEAWPVAPTMPVVFRRAGHILGSATVDVLVADSLRVVHSGDLGRWNQPILRDPEPVEEADVLLLESTYGGRVHADDPIEQLARVVREAAERGGALLIPAFAVGRAQHLIWTLRQLEEEHRIPRLPVYIDSPMANHVSAATCRHTEDHDEAMRAAMDEKRCPLCCKTYHLVASPEESKALNHLEGPMIVIAGSGMATGGRILHHMTHRLPDPRTTVLLVGFQASGTRGRSLEEGARTLRIYGVDVEVRARVEVVDGLSAHADQNEILRWLSMFKRPPRRTWIVHGEPGPAATLAKLVHERLGWSTAVAEDGARVALEA